MNDNGSLSPDHRDHASDVIPPYEWRTQTNPYPGKNWDANGQDLWQKGCSRPPAPNSLTPTLGCVEEREEGKFWAHFGYSSTNAQRVFLAIAAGSNAFDAAPIGRGQPDEFETGSHPTCSSLSSRRAGC